ncbi:VOC family protein [Mycolicibacterium parafortuitum]|uniref:Glyoxalase/bleomycin resistance protein/dioxygenase [Geodermatophilus obscurus DSM] n=1 Tax=Mycolicibacterium parafortuitum TaxID=39692 RepID=A0A375YR14_MYCPF|nr:VOC family protein [Mycolicibacterium parafortuitum]ORB29371.1 glyoxalase [Mycolicibacterium parafortuitum]SRX83404.1 glyoxalase/bleomycin resistance protein/dioxygenase [Geodermatophilus obscurus DSM] [Mycolicibacterium parafortuitum]
MTVAPIPAGYTSLTPFLCVERAADAIDFYTDVFGAVLVEKMDGPDDTVAHAELDFGSGRLQLGDPADAYGTRAPSASDDTVTYSVALYCADVDGVVAKAEQAGAVIREAPQDFATGDRFASLRDPFGVRWTVMTRVEDVSAEERDRRLAAWAKENVN